MDEYSEDMDVSVDVDVDTDIEVDIDTEVSDDIDMEIEDDIVEDEIEIEDDIVEDEIEIEDDIVEDEIEIEDDIIEDEVEIEDDIIEDEVEEDVVEDEVEVEEDVVEDEVEIEEDVVEDEVEVVEEPLEETEEVIDEVEEPLEETEEVVDEVEEPLEEVVDEVEEPLEEVVDEVEEPLEEIVDEDMQDNIAEDDSDDAVSEGASDDTTDDLPEADIHPLEEPLETETVEVKEATENIAPPEQHTFDDWLNPENYDEDGHYIGQGQDFGYKPEGMDTAEYAEQIDQEALDVYEDHIKQQEDYIPDDVIDDMMNDVEDIATDNKDIIQDIEDDIVGDEIKQVDKNPEIENDDTVISDTAKQPERSAMDAMTTYMYEHNYGKGDYPEYSQDPEWQKLNQALQEEMGIPVDAPVNDISPEIGDVKEQAAKDLMENYDVGKADFHDFDSDVASAVSDAVRDAKKDFPDLEVQYIGSIDSQVNGIREEYIDYYTKELEKIPDSGWTKDEMRTIAEYNANKTISNWGLDDTEGTFAWSLNIPKDVDPTGGKLEQYNGVAINNTYASDYNGFKEAKEEEVRTKHKPIGCNTPRATIDHELGHEIDNLLDASHDKKLMDLYDSMMSKGNAVNELSGYSQTNIKEFIAEGYSEYRNNPEPREYATKIYERLKELNQNRRRKSFWKKR